MKELRLLLLFLLLHIKAFAQCPAGDIVLVSQADVTAFVSANPGCTTIQGNLRIGDPSTPPLSNITSLAGLSGITAINGSLAITGNNQLSTLEGLNNLARLGSLEIGDNPLLSSLTALSAMTPADSSTFDLRIGSNEVLQTLEGLEGIRSARYVTIENSEMLMNLVGLSNLKSLSQGLNLFGNNLISLHGLENLEFTAGLGISTNRSLVSLDGLRNLTTVAGPIMLQDNDALANLKGLENLTSAAGLAIGRHDSMTSLEGLSSLSSIGYFILVENPLLTMCAVKPVCEYIAAPDAMLSIQDNGTGCNTLAQMEEACLALPVTLADFTATSEGYSAHLAWTTTEEVNSDHFEIQASLDAEHWYTVATVPSHGDSRQTRTYAYTHNNPFRPVSYYRLKMVDRDGTFAFSRIRSIAFNSLQVILYPNPATDVVYLRGLDLQKVKRISLIDSNGKTVCETDRNLRDGLSLTGVPPGLYLLTVQESNGSFSTFNVVKI